jgi:polyphosphate glucokinase
MMTEHMLGIDVGGSGIKGGLVDLAQGVLVSERYRIATPKPATPEKVAEVVGAIVRHFNYQGPIGVTFPAIVRHGVTMSAANVDPSWIGTNAQRLFERATGCPVLVLNDADAAGVAEMRYGAARGQRGVVMMLTFGTGIGSAVFINGQLVPNTELGHMEVDGKEIEARASDRARQRDNLSWKRWGRRVHKVLSRLEALFSPDLFVIGGGVSDNLERFRDQITITTPLVSAKLLNNAGIVGAALAASEGAKTSDG